MKLLKRSGVLATVIGLFLLGAGVATASATQGDPEHKDYVCKYVGKPGVDERLQTGNNPIWVDTAATDVGWFADGQARSYVIVFNTVKLTPEPGIGMCPNGDSPHENPLPTTRTLESTTCEKFTSILETTTSRWVKTNGIWALDVAVTRGNPVETTPTAAQIAAAGLTCASHVNPPPTTRTLVSTTCDQSTSTLETTTSKWVLTNGTWLLNVVVTLGKAVVSKPPTAEQIAAVAGLDCTVTAPPPADTPPAGALPIGAPAVGASPPEDSVEVLGVTATAPAKATTPVTVLAASATNPLPAAAAAGEADTSGQLALGGLAGLGALIAFGSAFVLRRRQSVI